MSPNKAANALLAQIAAPRGSVNVLPVPETGGGVRLVVWVSQSSAQVARQIPNTFHGFPVSVEVKPPAVAYH